MIPIAGINVQVVDTLGLEWRQFRFPRSKAKRVRKKWRKNRRNFRPHQEPAFYQLVAQNLIVTNPPGMRQLRASLRGPQREPNSYWGLSLWQ